MEQQVHITSKRIKKCCAFIFPSIIIFSSCTGLQKRIYTNTEILKPNDSKIRISKESIDRGKTHEVLFRLEKDVDAVNISIAAIEKPGEFAETRYTCKTYFIVEKIIDVTRFKNKKTVAFTEMGRNFDLKWERTNDLTILSRKNDPLLTLDKNAAYRIRFTAFRSIPCEYTVEIKADCRIFFE